MSTNRIEKVNSLMENELSKILHREIWFPDNVLITLTHVDATANLIEAKAYVSVFPEEKSQEIMGILKKNIYSIQQEINKKMKMRPVPKIIFVLDKNEAQAGRVEELLAKIKNEEGWKNKEK